MTRISIFLIIGLIFITQNIFAGTLSNDVSCDTGTFGSTGDSVELKANWSANAINVNFYNETEEVSKKTCEYDDVLELPEKPVKPGYQFIGWKLRIGLKKEDYEKQGGMYRSRSINGDVCDYRDNGDFNTLISKDCSSTYFDGLEKSEFESGFIYGKVKGYGTCSRYSAGDTTGKGNKIMTDFKTATKDDIDAEKETNDPTYYCWCHIDSLTRENSTTPIQLSLRNYARVYRHNGLVDCEKFCAHYCAAHTADKQDLRKALFGTQ